MIASSGILTGVLTLAGVVVGAAIFLTSAWLADRRRR